MDIEVYVFETKDGTEVSPGFQTLNPHEAKEHAQQHGLRVIARTFEYSDSEVVWDFTDLEDPEESPTPDPEPEPKRVAADECVVLANDHVSVRVPSYPDDCTYIRIVHNRTGEELCYWDAAEWRDQDSDLQCIGAIFGTLRQVYDGSDLEFERSLSQETEDQEERTP